MLGKEVHNFKFFLAGITSVRTRQPSSALEPPLRTGQPSAARAQPPEETPLAISTHAAVRQQAVTAAALQDVPGKWKKMKLLQRHVSSDEEPLEAPSVKRRNSQVMSVLATTVQLVRAKKERVMHGGFSFATTPAAASAASSSSSDQSSGSGSGGGETVAWMYETGSLDLDVSICVVFWGARHLHTEQRANQAKPRAKPTKTDTKSEGLHCPQARAGRQNTQPEVGSGEHLTI